MMKPIKNPNTALTKGDSLIKLPSNDPLTACAIVRTMIEMAPDHPVTRHMTVAYWKGGDEVLERRTAERLDVGPLSLALPVGERDEVEADVPEAERVAGLGDRDRA